MPASTVLREPSALANLVDLALRETYASSLLDTDAQAAVQNDPNTTLSLADKTYRRALRQRLKAEVSCDQAQREIKAAQSRIPRHLIESNTLGSVRHSPQYHTCLRPGRRFQGVQQSGRATYEVSVLLDHVDMDESRIAGTLRIQGLSVDHPTLTTFFEGEIVGAKHSFITHHKHWGASEKTDVEHWTRFQAFKPIASFAATRQKARAMQVMTAVRAASQRLSTGGRPANSASQADEVPSAQSASSDCHLKLDHLFMRWKELHAIESGESSRTVDGPADSSGNSSRSPPADFASLQQRNREQRRRILEGVSYEGFYYICLSLVTGHISGMYFHEASELYQQLSLKPVDASHFPAYEWR